VKLLGSGCRKWIKVQEVKESICTKDILIKEIFFIRERARFKKLIPRSSDKNPSYSHKYLLKINIPCEARSFLEFIIDNLHCHKNRYQSSEDINRTARKWMEEISARERFHFDSSRHWDFLVELWSCRLRRLDFIFGKPPAVCKTPLERY